MAQLRLILTTIVLTGLIWALADQLQKEQVDVSVSIRLVSELGEDMSVERVDDGRNPVLVRLEGRKRILSKYQTGGPIPVSVTVHNYPSGIRKMELLEILQSNLPGVQIVRVEPEEISVEIDHKIEVTVPVHVETGNLNFISEPTTEPKRVTVRLFENQWDEIPQSLRVLYVNADDYQRTIPKNEPFEIALPVIAELNGRVVEIQPTDILVRGQLQDYPTRLLKGVPIRFAANQEVFSKYSIDRPDNSLLLIQSITVRGPGEVLDQIESKAIPITGFINLTSEYATPSEEYRRLKPVFNLPEGVELVEEPSDVQFRLVDRPIPATDKEAEGK